MRSRLKPGFTLLEVMITSALLTIAMYGLVTQFVYCQRYLQAMQENTIATHAIRQMVEALQAYDFRDVYLGYGPQGAIGPDFAVSNLNPQSSDTDGKVGKIAFFTNETDTSADAGWLTLPRDLTGDGLADNTDIACCYNLLPAKVTAAWSGTLGNQTLELRFLLADQ